MEMVKKGRVIVVFIIVTLLSMSIIISTTTISMYARIGATNLVQKNLIQSSVRFLLTVLLLYFLYKGYQWAKWIVVVLFILAGIMCLFSIFQTNGLIMMVIGIVYFILSIILIASENVKYFFQYQRGEFPIINENLTEIK